MEEGQDLFAETKRLFTIFKTVLDMLEDREYYIHPEYRDLTLHFDAFEEKFNEKNPSEIRTDLSLPFIKKSEIEQKLFVFFEDSRHFWKRHFESKLKLMKRLEVEKAIIILRGDSSLNLAAIEKEYNIQFFKEDDLLINITKHELVPKHTLLNEEEREGLLKRYKLKIEQLPKIHDSDPVARYLGLERGDVVKVIRESETAGKYVTYRLVN